MNEATSQYQRTPSWGYLLITLVFALLLTAMPLPDKVEFYRPDWITLVVLYWVIALPGYLGVMFGWTVGLLEDIVSFALLGQHALGKALVSTVAAISCRQFRLFNFLQKMLLVMLLQVINIGINVVTNYLAFDTPVTWLIWWPALTTALVWPLVSFLLDQFDPNVN